MKALKIISYILGFPVMAALIAVASINVIKPGISYFPWVFAGLLVLLLLWLFYFLTALITGSISKRKGDVKIIRRCTVALALMGFFLTTGVWMLIDKFVPPILSDATSGTIHYSDLQENYLERAEAHGELLTGFIEMNVANGNLTKLTKEEYLKEGWQNEEIKELIAISYASIDGDGYVRFGEQGPWIDNAMAGRMTIPCLVHLLFDERPTSTRPYYFVGEGREDTPDAPIKWSILDMNGVMALDIDVSGMDTALLDLVVDVILDSATEFLAQVPNILAEDAALGAPIYIDLTIDTVEGAISVALVPAGESRGVWDYMKHAWFNSNQLLFAVISLFPLRNIMYVYGAVIVITSILIGIAREKQYGRTDSTKPAEEAQEASSRPNYQNYGYMNANTHPAAAPQYTRAQWRDLQASPYYRQYYAARSEERER